MTHDDREMWRINIENDADQVCSIYGEAAVDGAVSYTHLTLPTKLEV